MSNVPDVFFFETLLHNNHKANCVCKQDTNHFGRIFFFRLSIFISEQQSGQGGRGQLIPVSDRPQLIGFEREGGE